MAIENALLAGGAALSLMAGVVAGRCALLPAHGDVEAREMSPIRFRASPLDQDAQWTPPPIAAASHGIETVALPETYAATDADADTPAPVTPAVNASVADTTGTATTTGAETTESGPPDADLDAQPPESRDDRPSSPSISGEV